MNLSVSDVVSAKRANLNMNFVAELRSSGWVAGVVDDAAEQLRALADAGVERVLCQLLLHRDLDQVAVIGNELAPLVR